MFYFSKSDRRAFILLAIAAVAIVAALCLLPQSEAGKPVADTDKPAANADKPATDADRGNPQQDVAATTPSADAQALAEYFDPNTVDSLTLIRLGLTRHQVRSFLRYRAAGAVFEKPLDIAHLNSLSDDDIDRLLPLVRIADNYRNRRVKYPVGRQYHTSDTYDNTAASRIREVRADSLHRDYPAKFTTPTKVDPNTADTALLMKIPGIGRNIARWIVERRQRMGGFHHVEQLLEVNHVSADMLEWFSIADTAITHININKASFAQMSRFPYIGYDKARAVENRKRLYGPFANIDDVRASGIFTPDEIKRLQPYLDY